jgi:hypothetical protein
MDTLMSKTLSLDEVPLVGWDDLELRVFAAEDGTRFCIIFSNDSPILGSTVEDLPQLIEALTSILESPEVH